jgi:N-methylhydantoinase A/oxoprolinase/acetone carboxylase beta subunit/DUF917 family protein
MKWLTIDDLDSLAQGAALLGSGGGGEVLSSKLLLESLLAKKKRVALIDVDELTKDDLIAPVAYMGAPLISQERLSCGREFIAIIEEVQKILRKKVTAVMSAEIGGANALSGLIAACLTDLPLLDGDLIGRAFPRLEMSSANVANIKASPLFLCDVLGRVKVFYPKDAKEAEDIGREETINMGSSAAMCLYLMNGEEVKRGVIKNSISKALFSLGNVLTVFEGEIIDIDQRVEGGFLKGTVSIADGKNICVVFYQNENLLVKINGKSVVTTPDIISFLEKETFKIISCDDLRYGQRVKVVTLEAEEIWKNNLSLVGPKAFNFDGENTDYDSKSGRRADPCASDFKRSKQPLLESNRGDAELLKDVDAWEGAGPLFESRSVYMQYKIGVDIGGTNTDAVLVNDKDEVICFCKKTTTSPVEEGFFSVLKELLQKSGCVTYKIKEVRVGTTHAINAILERKNLHKVGLIRIGSNMIDNSMEAGFKWPKDLKEAVLGDVITINGGYECDKKEIFSFSIKEVEIAVERLLKRDVNGIAVVGSFACFYPEQELIVEKIIKEKMRKDQSIEVSLSHKIGGIGFLARENATILNTSLQGVLKKGFQNLKKIMEELNLFCPLFFIQNNGSILEVDTAMQYPILTIGSGPANSFVGAAKLTKMKEAIVIDIGGTSSDIGVICEFAPRRSINCCEIDGVMLNFPMPDIVSCAVGGGSIVDMKRLSIGPRSVGAQLFKKGVSFGGDVLTLTDAAIGVDNLLFSKTISKVDRSDGLKILRLAFSKIEEEVKKVCVKELLVVLVGGGASLFRTILPKGFVMPPLASVANAYGAALAQITHREESVVCLNNRDKVIELLKKKAIKQAINKGARRERVKIVDINITPYYYMPGNLGRVSVTASG